MQIRPFQSKDQGQVAQLIGGILSKEFGIGHEAYPYGDLNEIGKVYGGKREGFFVIADNDKVMGTVGIKEESKNTAIIRRLFVDRSCRNKGCGGLLIDRALDFCREKGYKEALFHAAKTMKSAMELCKSRGFKEKEELDLGGVDIVRLVKTF